jgi:FdhD protein
MTRGNEATRAVTVWDLGEGPARPRLDRLAVEEPLTVRVTAGGESRTVAITLRTPGPPGADSELAVGYLFSEGILRDRAHLAGLGESREETAEGAGQDVVEVALASRRLPDLGRLDRHVFTSSACGVCGRTALAARLLDGATRLPPGLPIEPALLASLPVRLRAAQTSFEVTGGLHAAARFGRDGSLAGLCEDVGRHNALDKLLGRAFLAGELGAGTAGLGDSIVLVTSRASFELVQKCAVAGVPVLAAVSAASSLAVEVARSLGLTLVGFLRPGRAVVYAGAERLGLPAIEEKP